MAEMYLRPTIVLRERRPRAYFSFEFVSLILVMAFVAGVFAGLTLRDLSLW